MEIDIAKARGSSFMQSFYNLVGAFLGIGILTLPYGLSKGGWLSLLLLVLIAIVSCYTGVLLKRCMQGHPNLRSYEDIALRAFGRKGGSVACLIVNMELYLVGIGLLIMEGENLNNLFPNFILKIGHAKFRGKPLYIILTALLISPTMFLTNMKRMSYVSAMGLFAIIVIALSVFLNAVREVRLHPKSILFSLKGIPISSSLFLTCFAGHPVIPITYMSMQDGGQFNKVMLASFSCNTIMYLLVSIIGYLMYADKTKSQITLNLPSGEVISKIAIYTSLIIPVSRYALLVTPVANAIENGPLHHYTNKKPIPVLIRISLIVTSTIVACVFPYFESLMAIVGSTTVATTSLLLPSCCYLKIYEVRRWSHENLLIIGIILFGTIVGIAGLYSSIIEIVQET